MAIPHGSSSAVPEPLPTLLVAEVDAADQRRRNVMKASPRRSSPERIVAAISNSGNHFGGCRVRSISVGASCSQVCRGRSGHESHDAARPLDAETARSIRSMNFGPAYTEVDNKERGSGGFLHKMFLSGLPLICGCLTACAAFCVSAVSNYIQEAHSNFTLDMLRTKPWHQAWAARTAVTMTLALLGGLPAIFIPEAAGSGILSVIAFLNGCDMRKHLTLKVLLAKLWGIAIGVASGLIVGPEGPMIFVGACIGSLLSKLTMHPLVVRILGTPPQTSSDDAYLRDCFATGAGCGVAAAFRAPIAGTLCVVEEAASHFQKAHLRKIFFAGLAAMEVIVLLTHGKGILPYPVTIGPFCNQRHGWEFLFYVFLGAVCGLAGVLFNNLTLIGARTRAKYIRKRPFLKMLDIAFLAMLTSTAAVGLPRLFEEVVIDQAIIFKRSSGCIGDDVKQQIISGEDAFYEPSAFVKPHVFGYLRGTITSFDRGGVEWKAWAAGLSADAQSHSGGDAVFKYTPKPCLYGVQHNPSLCPLAFAMAKDSSSPGIASAKACTEDLILNSSIASRADSQDFCCAFNSIFELSQGRFQLPANASCSIDPGKWIPSLSHSSDGKRKSYNPMASLSMVPLEFVSTNLYARGMPYLFPVSVLLVFLVPTFVLAAFTGSSSLPAGVLLPQLMCGAIIGRILSLLAMELQALTLNHRPADHSMWSPFYQLFFGSEGGPLLAGSEMINTDFLEPGMGALAGSAAFMAGSSHIALFTAVMMVEITGDMSMIMPIGIATVCAVLVSSRFNQGVYHSLILISSFPFLPDEWPKSMPRGLRLKSAVDPDCPLVVVPLSGDRNAIESALQGNKYAGFPVIDASGIVVGLARRQHLKHLLDTEPSRQELDIGSVTDFHCVTVRLRIPMEMAYHLFKRMEMTHLIATDDHHRPVAVMTRSSLLPWVVSDRVHAADAAGRGVSSVGRVRRPSIFDDTTEAAAAAAAAAAAVDIRTAQLDSRSISRSSSSQSAFSDVSSGASDEEAN